jgi:hypothetical protein
MPIPRCESLTGFNVLRPNSQTDKPSGNPTQDWKSPEEFERPGERKLRAAGEDTADDSILNENLQSLGRFGGKVSSLLNSTKIFLVDCIGVEGLGQNVRGSDGILNGKVDSNSTDRGHGVRRIADAEQAGTIPPTQSIDGDGEELDIVPVLNFIDTVGEEGGDLGDLASKCL